MCCCCAKSAIFLPRPNRNPVSGFPDETRHALAGITALLLGTELTVEQRHYAKALLRLLDAAEPPAPAPDAGGDALLDPAVLAELYRYLPPTGCTAIINQFRASADQLLTQIEQACQDQDWTRLTHAAHSLIGTAGAVGMAVLAAEARGIVVDLRAGHPSNAAARVPELRPLYLRGATALDQLIATLAQKSP